MLEINYFDYVIIISPNGMLALRDDKKYFSQKLLDCENY